MEKDIKRHADNATRIICAKLYQGGLSSANSILNDILKRPLTGKNPEYGIDVDSIEFEAKRAVRYHLQYFIFSAVIFLMGIIFSPLNSTASGLMIIFAASLITWKTLYLNKAEAIKKFSKLSYDPKIHSMDNSRDYKRNSMKDDQNVVIFGGNYPFLGAGKRTDHWEFVIDTSKPSKTLELESVEPKEISIKELYEDVSKKYPQ